MDSIFKMTYSFSSTSKYSTIFKRKKQLEPEELVETRRIASLQIHVEHAMERIKIFIFLTLPLTEGAGQMFFVCAVLTNFLPSLCS